MVELADTQDLGSCASQRAGSTPVIRTTKKESFVYQAKDSFFELSVPYGTISDANAS